MARHGLMTARVVVVARWLVGDEHDPGCRSVAFIAVDDEELTPWAEQVRRIADLIPHEATWEILPVPADVSQHTFFRSVSA